MEHLEPQHRIGLTAIAALVLVGSGSLLSSSLGLGSANSARRPTISAATTAYPVASSASATPMSCYDLPTSSALIDPQSCWLTGDTSALLVGSVPGDANQGAIAIVQGQAQNLVQLPGSGALQVTLVNGQSACVMDAQGEYRSVDLISGSVSASWSADCSLSTGNGAAVTPAVTPPSSSSFTATQHSMAVNSSTAAVPSATVSYYEYYSYYSKCGSIPSGSCPLYQQGATTHTPAQNGLVVLDFGAPCYVPGSSPVVYGVEMFFQPTCIPDSSLRPLVENWISGYETQNPNATVNLTLAIGTSNSYNGVDASYALTNAQMTASGQSWYQNLVGAISTSGLSAPLTIWGANDIEQSSDGNWYPGPPTVAWVQGFSSASPAGSNCPLSQSGYLADYGDDILGGSGSGDGWTVLQVYQVSWGLPVACALPEIYYSDMATEWQALNQWAVSNGYSAIAFAGVMTEVESGTLSPYQAWTALQSDTGQSPAIPSVTTIAWTLQGQPPPPPAVAMVSPSQGPVAGGTQVVLAGSNFLGAQAVDFGSSPAASFAVNDADFITAVTPSGSVGPVDVTVTTPEGPSTATADAVFTYGNGPFVGNVSPHLGPVDGGTSLTVSGSGFEGSGVTTTAVHIGGATVTSACPATSCFTVNSPTQITVTTPAQPPGQIDVTVTSSIGVSPTSATDKYTYQLPELIALDANSSWLTTSTFSDFRTPFQASTISFYGTVATLVGDVNGDGIPDLIAVNGNSVWVMLGSATGFLPPVEWSSSAFYGSQATLVGDVTVSGRADLIAVDGNSTWVMPSTGTGFLPPVEWSSSSFYGSQATLVGDVTGSGRAALIAVNANSTWVMPSMGVGFTAPEPWSTVPFYGSQATLVGDVNGDGRADLIAVNADGTWVMPSGGASFTAPEQWSTVPFYGGQATFALDVNGNGRADLVAVDSNQTWLMTSTGTSFTAPTSQLDQPFYGSVATLEAG